LKNTPAQHHIIIAFRGAARRKGFSQIPNVVTLDRTISSPAYRLYALLVSYAMQAEGSIASQGAIAEDLGCTDRSIRNWLDELEERGLISIHQQGQMRPNVYIIEDAYALYEEKKPDPKKGEGKQLSPEPSFRSSEESAFRSNRNGDSSHGGTVVPTLKELTTNKKEKNQEILPSASGEEQESALSVARRNGADKFAFIDNLRRTKRGQ
jgi:DNA-binding MarR family transcriptional regulator